MGRNGNVETSNVRLALAFGVLLVVVVVARLLVVWIASPSGWAPLVVSLTIVAVFVGIPAAYGLRGLLRGDGDDDS